jgi:hypothetical protein
MSTLSTHPRKVIVVPFNRALRIAIAALLVGGIGIGGFFIGQGTRKSDAHVAREQHAAVSRAVAAKGAADRDFRLKSVAREVAAQRARDKRTLHRTEVQLKRQSKRRSDQAYRRGSSNGYSAGNTAGYSAGNTAGYEAGTQDGLEQGSDDLTCSDDPDVYWLPACGF